MEVSGPCSRLWSLRISGSPVRTNEHSVQFICSVMSDSLWPHGLQHARLPCPSPTPGACSDSCPLSWWCHPLLLLPSIFSSISVFSNDSALHNRWPKTLLPFKIFFPLHTSRPSTLYMNGKWMNREDTLVQTLFCGYLFAGFGESKVIAL